jgi:hypothetical protein
MHYAIQKFRMIITFAYLLIPQSKGPNFNVLFSHRIEIKETVSWDDLICFVWFEFCFCDSFHWLLPHFAGLTFNQCCGSGSETFLQDLDPSRIQNKSFADPDPDSPYS